MSQASATLPQGPAIGAGPFLETLVGGAYDRAVMTVLMVLMVVLGATGVGAPLLIDEVLYLAGAFAMADHGSFAIDNGYAAFKSETLVPALMVVGPDGRILPQYPAGTFLIAWPFVELFGARGLAVMNGFAAAASLWLTRSIALALFGDRAIATGAAVLLGVASFLPDYASALWPHALALALVLAMVRMAIHAADAEGAGALRLGLVAGLIVGLTLTVRADAILLVPPVALWLVYAARAPIPTLVGAGGGLGIGLIVASLLNYLKFDRFTPLSYGTDGASGGLSVATFATLLMPLAVIAVAAVCLAAACRRPSLAPRALGGAAILGALGGAVALVAVPALRADAAGLWRGLHVLIVDMSASGDTRGGILRMPDGTVIFWGIAKQALGQSLPWIGLLLAFGIARSIAPRRRGMALCCLVIATIVMFFARTAWHGGMSANTRYFLPAMPFLAMLAAFALRDLAARAERSDPRAVLRAWGVGALALFASVLVVTLYVNDAGPWIRQPFATGLLAVTALAGLSARLPGTLGLRAARGAQIVTGAALAYAVVFANWGDLQVTRAIRQNNAESMAALPSPGAPYVLVALQPDHVASVLWNPDGWLSVPPYDTAFLADALRSGRRVLVSDAMAAEWILREDTSLRRAEGGTGSGFSEIVLR